MEVFRGCNGTLRYEFCTRSSEDLTGGGVVTSMLSFSFRGTFDPRG